MSAKILHNKNVVRNGHSESNNFDFRLFDNFRLDQVRLVHQLHISISSAKSENVYFNWSELSLVRVKKKRD